MSEHNKNVSDDTIGDIARFSASEGAPYPGTAETLGDGETTDDHDGHHREEQAALALEFLNRFYPEKLPAAQPVLSREPATIPADGIQFCAFLAQVAAAVLAVQLPTGDSAILNPKPNSKRKSGKGVDWMHKCQLVLGSDRIRFVNARKGIQCEYELPLDSSPIGINERPIAFEIPVFHFEGLFAAAIGLGGVRNRRREDRDSDAVTFTYDAAKRSLHIQMDSAHLQIPAEKCDVPPALPPIPGDCAVHGRSVAKTLDRALSHAGTFSSLNSDEKFLKVVTLHDGVARGGARAAGSQAESRLLKGLNFNLDRAVVDDVRSILRRLKSIQILVTDDACVIADQGFVAAVALVDHEFPNRRWFDHFTAAPRHWTMKMEDLLFAALSLDCLQARDSDRNPTLATLSIIEHDDVAHLKISAVAPGGIGDAIVAIEAVEHGGGGPEAAGTDPADDVFKPEATIRLAYVLRALKLVDGQQKVDLFMRQGMAMLRTQIDDLTAAHALSATGRHRSR